jgi:DNA-binding HxlR family transcriptional regulator
MSLCSVAKALELLGDHWTFLLIREALFGTRRFDDFATHLGIARNVLTSRLRKLIKAGILIQVPLREDARRQVYRLTEMGEDLVTTLLAMMQWGDRWLQTSASIPLRVLDRRSGKEVPPLRIRDSAGRALKFGDLDWAPGPGAGHPSIRPLVAAYEAQRRVEPRPIPKPPRAGKASPSRIRRSQ